MTFKCDCETHILKIEDYSVDEIPGLSFQIYDIYSEKGRKYKNPKLIADVVIMNNKYPKEYDKLVKFILHHYSKLRIENRIKPERMDKLEKGASFGRPMTIGKPEIVKVPIIPEGQMKWHKIIREDGRIEYICEHGVGHGNHVHGCCGFRCCSRKDYPGRN